MGDSHNVQQIITTGSSRRHLRFSTVPGYFLQDLETTNASEFNYATSNFGLISQTYLTDSAHSPHSHLTQWQRFERHVRTLNRGSPSGVEYKVLFMARHGEGYHNVAESFYGTAAWDVSSESHLLRTALVDRSQCYWAQLDGNGTITWADAILTEDGIAQAKVANDFWAHQFTTQKMVAPQSYYTSPLTRCLQTAEITFSTLDLPQKYPFVPTIKELLREGISTHTCDRRSSRLDIQRRFPSYKIEDDFALHDPLWTGIRAETPAAQDVRSKEVLEAMFATDSSTYISITSHSGEIASLLRVLGHRTFSLNTGAVIPVLVKAEILPGEEPATSIQQWTTPTLCTAPPATSIPNDECVCSGSVSTST
ncbi:putative phosphoglycerate mutase pmu1 [Elasticomyces elasticus]|nr:putative phosphoglycerate mutase pmu1 [Elasticomyces elasticus]